MAEYIDKKKAVQEIYDRIGFNKKVGIGTSAQTLIYVNGMAEALYIVDNVIAEDVAPIKHGCWEYEDVDIVCSVCGGDGVLPWNKIKQHKFPYCPHCGAKMDGDAE